MPFSGCRYFWGCGGLGQLAEDEGGVVESEISDFAKLPNW